MPYVRERDAVVSRASDDDLLAYVIYFSALFALAYEARDQYGAGKTILGVMIFFLRIKFAVLVDSAHAIAERTYSVAVDFR